MGLKITGLSGLAMGISATFSDDALYSGVWIGTDADCGVRLPESTTGLIRAKHAKAGYINGAITIFPVRDSSVFVDEQPVDSSGAIVVGPTALRLSGNAALFSLEPVKEPENHLRTGLMNASREPKGAAESASTLVGAQRQDPGHHSSSSPIASSNSTSRQPEAKSPLHELFRGLTHLSILAAVLSLIAAGLSWNLLDQYGQSAPWVDDDATRRKIHVAAQMDQEEGGSKALNELQRGIEAERNKIRDDLELKMRWREGGITYNVTQADIAAALKPYEDALVRLRWEKDQRGFEDFFQLAVKALGVAALALIVSRVLAVYTYPGVAKPQFLGLTLR